MNCLGQKNFVVPLDNHVKNVAILSIESNKKEIINESLLYSLVGAALENMNSNENIVDKLKKIDLTRVIKGAKEVNKNFTCPIFAQRSAWIYQSSRGHYRYYSRKERSIYSFDIFDLLGIIRNEKLKDVFNFIETTWGVTGITNQYIVERKKLEANINYMKKIIHDNKKYIYLNKLINIEHWSVLKKINEFACEKFEAKNKLVDHGDDIFFLSNNYLKETYFPHYAKSRINNLINLFCVLGFIEKVPLDEIPSSLSKETKNYQIKKKVQNHTSFYRIKSFESVSDKAEEIAKLLVENRLYYYAISKESIKKVFGEAFANKIYVQKTFGHKRNPNPIYIDEKNNFYTERERLEFEFLKSIKNTGKCSKTELGNSSLLSRSNFSILWNDLIQKYQCKEIYPTSKDMKRYKMQKRLLIAVPMDRSLISYPKIEKNKKNFIDIENKKRGKSSVL